MSLNHPPCLFLGAFLYATYCSTKLIPFLHFPGDKVHSWMCFTNQSIQRSKVLDTKLGRIRIYQSSKNDSIQECPENKDDKDLSVHGNYICDAKPSFNSSANVKKTDLNNYIYVDREMFLRINTSLDYGDVSQDKLLVQVKCWDSAKPLHIVTGKLTVHLRGKLYFND